ncbi:hypothetical protein CTA2_1609 [Colletotrichum tanaceti]|uniref:AB hydrolase-1 domain-containing protein n=1 Tax=Colletotrichum tanaceti TaxID=1306861 RepID=A0A4U6XQN7_9PEZI|nr:hypothetical protein CTA2_1609 [Colletotrichum tanaceti]TKW57979.1 hypothetical protein CTA1_3054 [Colletotrichum tanaceti]
MSGTMASSIPSKTLQVSPTITYRYYYSPDPEPTLQTLLFLHGFPSTAADFRPQLEHFRVPGLRRPRARPPRLRRDLEAGGRARVRLRRAMTAHMAAILDADGPGGSRRRRRGPRPGLLVPLGRLCHLLPPVLVVGCGRDEMTTAGLQDQMTRPWAGAGYRFEVLDTGHWVMLEDAAGTNRLLAEFLHGLSLTAGVVARG